MGDRGPSSTDATPTSAGHAACGPGCVNPSAGLHHVSCPRHGEDDPDRVFVAEGEALLAALNVRLEGKLFSDCDPIFRDATTGGTVYVGNIKSASSLAMLRERNITRVVNCQSATSRNMHEGKDIGVTYFRFPVAEYSTKLWRSDDPVSLVDGFVEPLFCFVDEGVARGESVLIHCLAGAHRAGTTGVVYLMHRAELPAAAALAAAKRCRSVINPIGFLQDFIVAFDTAQSSRGREGARTDAHTH